jgi:hypothetical protein
MSSRPTPPTATREITGYVRLRKNSALQHFSYEQGDARADQGVEDASAARFGALEGDHDHRRGASLDEGKRGVYHDRYPQHGLLSATTQSARLPPGLRRWRITFPEEACTGAATHRWAKDASLRRGVLTEQH